VLRPLAAVTRRVVVTRSLANARAEPPERLAQRWRSLAPAAEVDVAHDPGAALRAALGATDDGDLVLVAGSLFLVGEVRTLLGGGRPSTAVRWQ
jgi:dihydrofolate synthase / folylpolyglutamate synthase